MTTTIVAVVRPRKHERLLLEATVAVLARVTRTTFRWLHQSRKQPAEVKRAMCARFGILARHWSGCRADAAAAARSWREGARERVHRLRDRIEELERRWKKDCERPGRKRRNAVGRRKAETELVKLGRELAAGRPRWCFGGRRLLRQSRLAEWRRKRDSVALFCGETAKRGGNEVAQWSGGELRLRLPDGVGERYVVLDSVTFPAKQQALLEAAVAARRPVSWRVRLLPRGKVELCATFTEPEPSIVSGTSAGIVAVDANKRHLAVTDVSSDGQVLGAARVPLGHGSDAVWQVARELVAQARVAGRPLALEDLDFRRKKAWLRSYGKRFSEVLSTFRTRQLQTAVERAARRWGVEVWYVDPAWTTRLGVLKYARRLRLGGHCAAGLVIGRRALGFGERLLDTLSSTLTCTVECVSTSGSTRTFVQRLPAAWLEGGRRRQRVGARVVSTPAVCNEHGPMGSRRTPEVSLPLAGLQGPGLTGP